MSDLRHPQTGECMHDWVLVSGQAESYVEIRDGVTVHGGTGNLLVTVACVECERFRSFVATPLEPDRG